MALNEMQLSLLTDEQRDRYASLESLFEHPGWKIVSEFADASVQQQANRALNATNWNEHQLATGARAAFLQIVNLQDVTETEFANLAAQAMASQEEEDEIDYE